MKRLSVFVDESGDFGPSEKHSPFYIFTMVFHDQDNKIDSQIRRLEQQISELGFRPSHCFHAGPIIRREEEYIRLTIQERRRCLNRILTFAKSCDISYASFFVEKKQVRDSLSLTVSLSKQLSDFIRKNYSFFQSFDQVIIYYDNGQVELNKILASVFSVLLTNVEFRRVLPAQYRLFQVADLLCTLKLISLKAERKILSDSEMQFFGNLRDLHKNYLKPIERLKFKNQS